VLKEESFEHIMANIVLEFKNRHPEFEDLTAAELQDELWKNDSAIEFMHILLEKCEKFSTDKIFGYL
jgi:hypothetical protein